MSMIDAKYRCEWAGDRRRCPEPATGYVGAGKVQHPLCTKHLDPKFNGSSFALHPGEPITAPCSHAFPFDAESAERIKELNRRDALQMAYNGLCSSEASLREAGGHVIEERLAALRIELAAEAFPERGQATEGAEDDG